MDVTDERLADSLAAFEKEQDPTLLHQALDLIEAAEREIPPGDTAARRKAVSWRLRFFATLERHIDPRWNVDEQPVLEISPPVTRDGVVHGSGAIDPASIADPVERAEYERALKASMEQVRWYEAQYQLRRLDERAMRFAELFLAQRYTGSPEEGRELEELLAEWPVDETRKERLRAALGRGTR
jgi:hypothetical protein